MIISGLGLFASDVVFTIDEITETSVTITSTYDLPSDIHGYYDYKVIEWTSEVDDSLFDDEDLGDDFYVNGETYTKKWSGLEPGTRYMVIGVKLSSYGVIGKFSGCEFATKAKSWTVDYDGYSLEFTQLVYRNNECSVRGANAPSSPTTIVIPSEVSDYGTTYEVTYVYEEAFASWKNAISFTLPNTIKTIGEFAFSECTSMDNLILPESVELIGANAFEKCLRMVTVNVSNTVKEIGDNAFLDCTSLFKITIPGSVSDLGEGVFKNCTGLKDVTFGDDSKITKLKDSTFEYCEKLKNVTFGENSSITSINQKLFEDCPNIETIVFGDNAKLGIIEENALKDHTKLSKVIFGANSVLHTIYDYSFQGCTSLTTIEIPSSISLLGRSAFEGCGKLSSFVIPEGVKSLGNSTFKDCTSLRSFELSSTVTTIPNYAFSGCTSLRKMICKATDVPVTGNEVFESVPNTMVVYVPKESLSLYQLEEPWKDYTLKAIEDGIEPDDEPETFGAPKNLKIKTIDSANLELTWDAVDGAIYYVVYIYYDGEYYSLGNIETNSCIIEIDEVGVEYCFAVTAANDVEESDYSDVACVVVGTPDEPEEPGDEPEEPGDEPEEPGDAVEEVNNNRFVIYPNPVEDNLMIEANETIEEVAIYTITGVTVYCQHSTVRGQQSINVSDLNSGIYFIKVRTENGETVKRFVKK